MTKFPTICTAFFSGSLAPGATVKGKLSAASEIDERYLTFKRDHLLDPVAAGEEVVLTLSSTRFDAYLIVLDASDLTLVTEADSGGPAARRAVATMPGQASWPPPDVATWSAPPPMIRGRKVRMS